MRRAASPVAQASDAGSCAAAGTNREGCCGTVSGRPQPGPRAIESRLGRRVQVSKLTEAVVDLVNSGLYLDDLDQKLGR